MLTLNIDGKKVQADEGATILMVAQNNLINIPTLCDNEEVSPYGACRLCLVEITTTSGKGRTVPSCLYPVEEGLTVRTATDKIISIRRMLIELLLARCPDSELIQDMAKRLGINKTHFRLQDGNKKCILCALCARTCEEIVGVSAISLTNRGVNRQLSTPFNKDYSEACIGCGSCAYICPTNAITMEDINGIRRLFWPHNETKFELAKCKVCGGYWAPKKQLEYIAKQANIPMKTFDVCPDCRD
ncbi:2Fe-2S iron-sulfur cluster-binding protein [Chloroflexota bacterium]